MSKDKISMTSALRLLRTKKVEYTVFNYDYKDNGGTAQTAAELNIDEHIVIKTLVLSADAEIIIMLMHGDKEVSLKNLARELGCKSVEQCDSKTAAKATGYVFGGTSPFGTAKKLRVIAEKSIFDLDSIYINGGRQGLILKINPSVISKLFQVTEVCVAV